MKKWQWTNGTRFKTIAANQMMALIEFGLNATTPEEKAVIDQAFERVHKIYDQLHGFEENEKEEIRKQVLTEL